MADKPTPDPQKPAAEAPDALQLGLKDQAPSGVITITGTATESVMLVYEALNAVADLIAARVKAAAAGAPVIIRNDVDLAELAELDAVLATIDLLEKRLARAKQDGESVLPHTLIFKSVIAATNLAASVLGELIALPRVDRTIAYSAIEVADQALIAAVTGALTGAVEIFDGALTPGGAQPAMQAGSAPPERGLRERLAELGTLGDDLHALLIRIAAEQARLAKAPPTPPVHQGDGEDDALREGGDKPSPAKPPVAPPDGLAAAKTRIEASLAELDAASAAIKPTLARLLAAEAASRLYRGHGKEALILSLKVVAGSGSHTTQRGFFWFQNTIAFSGGVVVSYGLYRQNGAVVSAGTIPAFSGPIALDTIKPGSAAYGAIVPRREEKT